MHIFIRFRNISLVLLIIIFSFHILYNSKRSVSLNSQNLKKKSTTNENVRFSKYIKLHNSIIKKNESELKRVSFAVNCFGGYGNKIYGLLNTFVIAIITDSAIKIEWPNVEKYIDSPLNDLFNKVDLNSQLSLSYKNSKLNDTYSILPISNNEWVYEKKLENIVNKTIPTDKKRYVHNDCRAAFFSLCANPIYFEKFLDYGIVKKKTIMNALEINRMKLNLTDSNRIERLYMVGFEVGSNLLNKIWVIEPNLTNEINKIYEENFKNYFVIGMQFRFEYINENDISHFIKCAKFIQKLNNVTNVKWFITSDMDKIFKILDSDYKDIIIKGKGKIGHILSDSDYYYRAIMDIELLSKTNEMIITGGSTFGFTSAFRKQVLPYFIEGKRPKSINEDQPCNRMTFNKAPRTHTGYAII